MNVLLSYEIRENSFTVTISLPEGGNTFLQVAQVVNLAFGFIWQLSQGSAKALNCIQPLRIVEDTKEEEEEPTTEEEEVEQTVSNQFEKSELLSKVEEGLKYNEPELCEDGVNGTYFLKDLDGEFCGVFKPTDEEGYSVNNPKRSEENKDLFINKGLKEGEAANREVAAYLLDKGHFSGVPETSIVTLEHPNFETKQKTGSLQLFVQNEGCAEDFGPSKFPSKEVHKIGILDLRIFNNDRHGGNILIKEKEEDGTIELIPIDHGLSLPSSLNQAWFDWLYWPQAKVPFDEETRRYIDSIDIEDDANLLREIGIREECIRTMIISSTLLKKGAAADLTLFEIALLVCRSNGLETPSALEVMVEKAKNQTQDDSMLKALWPIMDEEIANLRK